MSSRLTSGSLAAIQYPPNGCDKPLEFDRFGVELLAPRGNRLLALASQRMCGQDNDWNVSRLRVTFQTPRRFPAVNDGHFEVHQDNIRLLGRRHLAPLLAVPGRENLESPKKLKPHFEHIDVVIVVFDIKHFDDDAVSILFRTAGLLSHRWLHYRRPSLIRKIARSTWLSPPARAVTCSRCDTWAHPTDQWRRPLLPRGTHVERKGINLELGFEGVRPKRLSHCPGRHTPALRERPRNCTSCGGRSKRRKCTSRLLWTMLHPSQSQLGRKP